MCFVQILISMQNLQRCHCQKKIWWLSRFLMTDAIIVPTSICNYMSVRDVIIPSCWSARMKDTNIMSAMLKSKYLILFGIPVSYYKFSRYTLIIILYLLQLRHKNERVWKRTSSSWKRKKNTTSSSSVKVHWILINLIRRRR